MEYPYVEGDVRRKPVPQHDTQIAPATYGELPGEYESSYRPDSQAYHEKTAYGSTTPDPPRGRVPNYKPAPLKWPFLCLLGAILLGLIALTEYSCRVLPSENGRVPIPTAHAIKIAMGVGTVGKRQGSGSGTTPLVSLANCARRQLCLAFAPLTFGWDDLGRGWFQHNSAAW